MSRPSASRSSPIASGGRKRNTLPKVPQVSVTRPCAEQARCTAPASAASGVRPGPSADQLDRQHGAAAADVADPVGCRSASARSRGRKSGLDLAGPAGQVLGLHGLDRAERGGAGDRVAAVGAAEAADVDGVHHLGPTGDGGQGQAAGDALGGGDQVGDDALVVAGEPVAGAAKPVWISSAMSRMPCSRHQSATRGSQPGGGTMKPPSPWIGSMSTAAQLSSPTWACTVRDERRRRPRRRTPRRRPASGRGRPSGRGRSRRRTARSRACRACSSRSAPS